MADDVEIIGTIVHIWPMLQTAPEFMLALGSAVRTRRIGLRLTQEEAALRAGVAHRTWRRLEAGGEASIEDLVKAALALRCEEGLSALFPALAASSLDALLASQKAAKTKLPQRVRKPRPAHPQSSGKGAP